MKMTFTKSVPDVPVGKYTARFTGVTLKDASGKLDEKGKPMPPAMTWNFVIVGGPCDGREIDRLTSRTPTPKSGCGKILAGISDEVLTDGAEVDLGQFTGKLYRITVEENGDRTRLSDNPAPVRMYDERPAGQPVSPPAGKGPPPKKGPPPAAKAAPAPNSKWMMHDPDTGEYRAAEGSEVEDFMTAKALMAEDVWVYPDDGKEHEPKAAKEHGFKGHQPF
jgi:hypothetical protein